MTTTPPWQGSLSRQSHCPMELDGILVLGKAWLCSAQGWRFPGAISTSTVPWEGAGNCWVPHAQPSHGEFTPLAAASQSQQALTCPSDHPGCWRRSAAKSLIYPFSILACQRERRAESGSYEDAVVSNTLRAAAASLGLVPALALSSSRGCPRWDKYCWPKDPGPCPSGFS